MNALMLGNTIVSGSTAATGAGSAPDGALPLDAYQQPELDGDEGYWRFSSGGYYQEPLP